MYGSVDGVPAYKLKECRFDPQSGHTAVLRAMSSDGGVQEAFD